MQESQTKDDEERAGSGGSHSPEKPVTTGIAAADSLSRGSIEAQCPQVGILRHACCNWDEVLCRQACFVH